MPTIDRAATPGYIAPMLANRFANPTHELGVTKLGCPVCGPRMRLG